MLSTTLRINVPSLFCRSVCRARRVNHIQLRLDSPVFTSSSFTVASSERRRRLSASPKVSHATTEVTEHVLLERPVTVRKINNYLSTWDQSRHLILSGPPFMIHEDAEQLFKESGFHVYDFPNAIDSPNGGVFMEFIG